MNRWRVLKKVSKEKFQPCISKSAKINPKAEISGKVFIDDEVNIGKSKLIAEDGCSIFVGKAATIKDCVLISNKNHKFDFGKLSVRDIHIGNKVFISSDVSIYGSTVISDGAFIGNNTTIVNSKIGQNCVIEDRVFLKNIVIPPGAYIPSKSIVDSNEKLKELIIKINQGDFCDLAKAV